jgi:large subunit ribosomal protein L21e
MGKPCTRAMGYRAGTRDLFSKKPREKGAEPLSTYMRTYKVGDQVDIVCRSSQQKGMPHKFYHGRTGKVWNVSKRAIGVEINKIHREKQIVKRIHVRVEHLRPSKSQSGHLARIRSNEAIKKAAKQSGTPAPIEQLKRLPKGPRDAFQLEMAGVFEQKVHTLTPLPYVFVPLGR